MSNSRKARRSFSPLLSVLIGERWQRYCWQATALQGLAPRVQKWCLFYFRLPGPYFSSVLGAMAASRQQSMADMLEIRDTSTARIATLESQMHMLSGTAKAKAKQLKGEKRKRDRMLQQTMAVANSIGNLEDELSSLRRVKKAKSKELKNEKQKRARMERRIVAAAAALPAPPGGAA